MECKFYALLLMLNYLMCSSCNTASEQQMPKTEPNVLQSTHSNFVAQVKPSLSQSSCRALLDEPAQDESEVVYSDSLQIGGKQLFFLTRDSTFYIYQQNAAQCELLLEKPIDRDLYFSTDGSHIVLEDLDGDSQKEVCVQIFKNKNQSKYWVFRILDGAQTCTFKKIERFEELMNPEYDPKTGLIRSSWGDKYNEGEEFYKLSKADRLSFVKGTKSNAKIVEGERETTDTEYTTKEGW